MPPQQALPRLVAERLHEDVDPTMSVNMKSDGPGRGRSVAPAPHGRFAGAPDVERRAELVKCRRARWSSRSAASSSIGPQRRREQRTAPGRSRRARPPRASGRSPARNSRAASSGSPSASATRPRASWSVRSVRRCVVVADETAPARRPPSRLRGIAGGDRDLDLRGQEPDLGPVIPGSVDRRVDRGHRGRGLPLRQADLGQRRLGSAAPRMGFAEGRPRRLEVARRKRIRQGVEAVGHGGGAR